MFYAMHDLKYSPSQLMELYEADYKYKAFLFGLISVKLEELAKEASKNNK